MAVSAAAPSSILLPLPLPLLLPLPSRSSSCSCSCPAPAVDVDVGCGCSGCRYDANADVDVGCVGENTADLCLRSHSEPLRRARLPTGPRARGGSRPATLAGTAVRVLGLGRPPTSVAIPMDHTDATLVSSLKRQLDTIRAADSSRWDGQQRLNLNRHAGPPRYATANHWGGDHYACGQVRQR